MAQTLGTRGYDGRSLVRDKKAFGKRLDAINFKDRKSPVTQVDDDGSGKKRYHYGKRPANTSVPNILVSRHLPDVGPGA